MKYYLGLLSLLVILSSWVVCLSYRRATNLVVFRTHSSVFKFENYPTSRQCRLNVRLFCKENRNKESVEGQEPPRIIEYQRSVDVPKNNVPLTYDGNYNNETRYPILLLVQP